MSSKKLFERIESVNIDNVSKRYGDVFAVKDFSLDIVGGELMMLIGPSGSGKTTTLRMVNRLIEPDQGDVFINEESVKSFDPVSLRRNIGYVIQQIGLFPHLSVRDNIGIIPRLEGWDKDSIDERVRDLLDLVALPPDMFMERHPAELSGGQQQRVGLARALAMDPPLLLMDEPFGALDPILRIQLQDEFFRIKQELRKTIIFVTHDIEESFKLGDRIAIMKNAKLAQLGTADQLVLEPNDEFVSEIVDSGNKFKHVNRMLVGDMMVPLEARHRLRDNVSVSDAVIMMCKNNVELAIVENGEGRMMGWATISELYRADGEVMMGDVAKEPIIFPKNGRLRDSLEEMKAKGARMALVGDEEGPSGLLLLDEALFRLL